MNDTQSLDINKAFKFYFQDPEWLSKTVVAGLLYITLIGIPAVTGWLLVIQRREMEGQEPTLPTWDQFGDYFVVGLKYWLVTMIWNLPYFVLIFGTTAAMFASTMWLDPESGATPGAFIVWSILLQPVTWLGLAYSMLIYGVSSGLVAERYSFRDGLEIKRGVRLLRVNWKQFLGASLLGWMAMYAGQMLGMALLCVGLIFTIPIGMAIMHNLCGQAFRIARDRLAEQTAVAIL